MDISRSIDIDGSNYYWELAHFGALSGAKLHNIYAARQAVFIVEQSCAYQDIDQYDEISHHLMCWHSAQGDPALIAYLRIVPPGAKYAEPSLGRILTAMTVRGQGVGRELVQRGLIAAGELFPDQNIRISAQHYLERFYQSFGFATVSAIYDEDGIPHVEMVFSLLAKS